MPAELISVSEARELISKHIELLNPVHVPLIEAAGLVLSVDVHAKTDVPPFNQSSMDGYAFNYDTWAKSGELKIQGEVAAGSSANKSIEPQNAIRIFTGAPVPEGADTVVMQEKVKVDRERLLIEDNNLTKGMNFRAKGSEIKSGALALKKGTLLSPAAIGYLAGVGIHEVIAYPNLITDKFTNQTLLL